MLKSVFDDLISGIVQLHNKESQLLAIFGDKNLSTFELSPEYSKVFDTIFNEAYGEDGSEIAYWWLYELGVISRAVTEVFTDVSDLTGARPITVDGADLVIKNAHDLYIFLEEQYGAK